MYGLRVRRFSFGIDISVSVFRKMCEKFVRECAKKCTRACLSALRCHAPCTGRRAKKNMVQTRTRVESYRDCGVARVASTTIFRVLEANQSIRCYSSPVYSCRCLDPPVLALLILSYFFSRLFTSLFFRFFFFRTLEGSTRQRTSSSTASSGCSQSPQPCPPPRERPRRRLCPHPQHQQRRRRHQHPRRQAHQQRNQQQHRHMERRPLCHR